MCRRSRGWFVAALVGGLLVLGGCTFESVVDSNGAEVSSSPETPALDATPTPLPEPVVAEPTEPPSFSSPSERSILDAMALGPQWLIAPDGRQAAGSFDHFLQQHPDGPRVRIDRSDDALVVPEQFPPAGDLAVVDEPAMFTIFGGIPAASIMVGYEVDGRAFNRRWVVAYVGDTAFTITLAAPAAMALDEFETALDLRRT